MGFSVLKIPSRGQTAHQFSYRTTKNGKHITFFIPQDVAAVAGFEEKGTVRFAIGSGEHTGCFALVKGGSDNHRVLNKVSEKNDTLKAIFPYVDQLKRVFPPQEAGYHPLRIVENQQGADARLFRHCWGRGCETWSGTPRRGLTSGSSLLHSGNDPTTAASFRLRHLGLLRHEYGSASTLLRLS